MNDITQILSRIESGDPSAAAKLLPLVYDELRKLAAQKLAHELPGQTLQATALVHEAYLRLVGNDQADEPWQNQGHFFAAAAEAMRRILVENARRKRGPKQGGDYRRVELDLQTVSDLRVDVANASLLDILALDDALTRLDQVAPDRAQLVKLRFFAGLTLAEAARVLGVSRATAARQWTYARAWLYEELNQQALNKMGGDNTPADQRLRDTGNDHRVT
jgi:RNA polymerase sigma factor (TIGR02999 family)